MFRKYKRRLAAILMGQIETAYQEGYTHIDAIKQLILLMQK